MSKPGTHKSYLRSKPLVAVLLCIWASGTLTLVSLLSSQDRGDEENTLVTNGTGQPTLAALGWTVRHQLIAGEYVSELVAAHLIARHPIPGIKEEITLQGSAAHLEDRLVAAGWRVTREEK